MMSTVYTGRFMFGPPESIFQQVVQTIVPRPHPWPLMRRCYEYTPLGSLPTEGRKWYDTHNERVRTVAEGKPFLEYNVKEGWGPLCKFLEVEEPDIPFPRVNDTKAWLDTVGESKRQSMLTLLGNAGKVFIPVVLGSIALWYMRRTG